MRFQVIRVETEYGTSGFKPAQMYLSIQHYSQLDYLQRVSLGSGVYITADPKPEAKAIDTTLELNIESVGDISNLNASSAYQAIPLTIYCVSRYAKRLKQELMSGGKIIVPVSAELKDAAKASTGSEMPLMQILSSETKPDKEKNKKIDLKTEYDKATTSLAQHIGLLTNERKKTARLEAQLESAQREISRITQERNKAMVEVTQLNQETQLVEHFVNLLCQVLEEKELKEPRGDEVTRFTLLEIE